MTIEDTKVLTALIPHLYKMIDDLLDTPAIDKQTMLRAKRLLPSGYKHSFEKEKRHDA